MKENILTCPECHSEDIEPKEKNKFECMDCSFIGTRSDFQQAENRDDDIEI